MLTTVEKYFCIVPLKSNFASCRICLKEIKNSANSRNQKAHLKRCHPQEFATIQRPNTAKQCEIVKSGDISELVAATTLVSNLKPTRKRKLTDDQNGLHDPAIFSKILKLNINNINNNVNRIVTLPKLVLPSPSQLVTTKVSNRTPSEIELYQQKLPDVMLHFLIKHNVPLKSIECEKYKTLMKEYLPQFKLFDKKELVMRLEVKHLTLSFILKSRFKEVDWFVLTTEAWTNPTFGQEYWAVTAHYMWNFEAQSVMIGVFELRGEDVNAMRDDLVQMSREWGIHKEKIIGVVTDSQSGANVAKAVDLFVGEDKRLQCFASTVNQIPINAIKNSNGLAFLLNKVKGLVVFFKDQCEAAYNELKDADGNGNKLKMTDDVCVSWIDTYYMVDAFLLMVKGVDAVISKYPQAPVMVTPSEVEIIREIADALRPFIQVVEELSEESFGEGSKLVPLIYCLKTCLKKKESQYTTQLGKEFRQYLETEMNQRFECFEQAKVLTIASLLDPRFKKVCISNQMVCADAVSDLVQEVFAATTNSTSNDIAPVETPSNVNLCDLLVAEANRRIKEAEIAANMPIDVQHHFERASIPLRDKPVEYWKGFKELYPRISKVALKYLTVCASSVPANRLFTKAGRAWCEARSELKGRKLPKLMFLQSLKESEWRL